jgi:hypothetical protein
VLEITFYTEKILHKAQFTEDKFFRELVLVLPDTFFREHILSPAFAAHTLAPPASPADTPGTFMRTDLLHMRAGLRSEERILPHPAVSYTYTYICIRPWQ